MACVCKKDDRVSVIVVGSVALDTVETTSDRREDVLGGSVSYACAAASFFGTVGMVGVAGEDFPQRYTDVYKGLGIDLAGLQRMQGQTFRWSGVYEADMNNRRTLLTELNVFEKFQPSLPEAYRDSPFVFLANISPELQLHVLEQVRNPRFIMVDTMDLWIRTAIEPLKRVMARANMVMVNDSEARMLAGEHNLVKAAGRLLAMGPKYVVIKKGEHGAMLFSASGTRIIPAYPLEDVLDPTGAGDTFAGGLIGALARSGDTSLSSVQNAMLYGSVVASFGVEAFSLEGLIALKPAAIEDRLTELRMMMSVPSR